MRPWRKRIISVFVVGLATVPPRLAVVEANTVDQVLSRCPRRPHTFNQLLETLTLLDRSDRVWVGYIGKSVNGRPIPLVAIHHPQTVFGQAARLFIIARQHGSEVAGTEAMMALTLHLAGSSNPADVELLRRLTFAIVPVVNPDGAVDNRRDNAAGVDLNRDWGAVSQPETRAVEWAFRVWRPHAFIDCHELPAQSNRPAYQYSFIETIADDPALDRNMTALCGFLSDNARRYLTAYGARLNVYYDSSRSDRRLAHRHFGLDWGTPAFLFESKTGAGYSLQDRIRFHVVGTLVIANLLAQRVSAPPPATPVGPTMPMPQAPTVPPDQRPQYAAETTIFFASPPRDRQSFSEEVPLRIEVRPSPEFAYISIHVDGIMRAITDAAPYEVNLSLDGYESGTHTIVCRAHDNSGRVIASAERIITVNNILAGP